MTLWNIWKARNETIFQNKPFNKEVICFKSKRDVFGTILRLGLVAAKDDLLWNTDPLAALENHNISKKRAFILNLTKSCDNIAFKDGSWANHHSRGIGGFILSKDLHTKYLFPGPISRGTPLRVEIEACKHAWRILGVHFSDSYSIYTDSKNLQEMASKSMQGDQDTRERFADIENLVLLFPKVKICYIDRNWNNVADSLNKVERE